MSNRDDEINLIDLIALMIVPFFAGAIFGVVSFEVSVFGGYNFTEPIWTIAGADISLGILLVVGSVVWILLTNEFTGSDYEPVEFAMIGFALLSPVLFVFVPAFESLVMWHDLMQIMFTIGVTLAATWISYVA